MPPRRSTRRPRKLFRKKPLFKRKPRQVTVNRALQPIPQRYICKMKYAETITTNATGQYTFNLNDIVDPNRTGGGHRPYSYNTMAALYNRWRVINCSYRLIVNSQTNAIMLGAIPANEAINFTTLSEMLENPRTKYAVANAGGNAVVVSGNCYIPSIVGRSKSQYMADDRYQAIFGSQPQEVVCLNIKTTNNADVNISANVQVMLEYTVECFDYKKLEQSTI